MFYIVAYSICKLLNCYEYSNRKINELLFEIFFFHMYQFYIITKNNNYIKLNYKDSLK